MIARTSTVPDDGPHPAASGIGIAVAMMAAWVLAACAGHDHRGDEVQEIIVTKARLSGVEIALPPLAEAEGAPPALATAAAPELNAPAAGAPEIIVTSVHAGQAAAGPAVHGSGHLAGLATASSGPALAAPPAPVASSAAGDKPLYQARLTNSQVRRQADGLLSVAVSVRLDADQLRALLDAHQKGISQGQTPVATGGTLITQDWYGFQYILARIQCPDFLNCPQQAPQSRTNDPLIWDWPLSAAKWDQTRSGPITVTFFGDQDAGGRFSESIAAMPPLTIQVSVYRDLTAWDQIAKTTADLLSQLKTILITLGAIVAVLIGWKTKVWQWFSRR